MEKCEAFKKIMEHENAVIKQLCEEITNTTERYDAIATKLSEEIETTNKYKKMWNELRAYLNQEVINDTKRLEEKFVIEENVILQQMCELENKYFGE